MIKKMRLAFAIGISLILVACGTTERNNPVVNGSGGKDWKVLKTISGRNIIAELEQTAKDTEKRENEAKKIEESEEFGEELTIQQIEGAAAMNAIQEMFGDQFDDEGVLFYEGKTTGADQSGFWIGMKEPDERLNKLMQKLQKQVDAGEILAKYIYIYQSPYTQKELESLTNKVAESLSELAKTHEKPDRVSFGVFVNTTTGIIEISHDFITDEQKEKLEQTFTGHEIAFTQEGMMVPVGEEPEITYPSEKTVNNPSKEGSYVISVTENGMMVVDAEAMNFGETGGDNEFYSAISYKFAEADKKLEVGQRVKVESSGPILESYPAQGTAKFVKVLPEYKPDNAELSESQIIRIAVEKAKSKSNWVPAIRSIEYDEKADVWKVSIKQEDGMYDVEIEDRN